MKNKIIFIILLLSQLFINTHVYSQPICDPDPKGPQSPKMGVPNPSDSIQPDPGPSWPLNILGAGDPNEITGPDGYSEKHWVSVNDIMNYTIHYENDPKIATASASVVRITYPIDTNQAGYTFRLGRFGFGGYNFEVPPNTSTYSQQLDLIATKGIFVNVTAGLDVISNHAFWIFETIDPGTGLPPFDPSKGFLPVRDTSLANSTNDTLKSNGQGYVDFTIKPLLSAHTADTTIAKASIIFDINEPVTTNKEMNTIDALPPVSSIGSLPPVSSSSNLVLIVHKQDDSGGCGVKDYDLYVSQDSGSFQLYQTYVTDTIYFAGAAGRNYRFFTIAQDNVGNREKPKAIPDATTTILGGCGGSFGVSATLDSACSVGNIGAIDITMNAGVSPFTFKWSNDEITEDIENLSAGTYSVTINDAGRCTDSATFVIYPIPATTYYLDSDSDSYGNAINSIEACAKPSNYVANNTDCNDGNSAAHPGANELCNGVDDNCDGQIDNGVVFTKYYHDSDGDGYGNPNDSTTTCSGTPLGYVTNNTDCNDGDGAVHPGASELCNGIDDNCDSQIDNGVVFTKYYADSDVDGYGNPNDSIISCSGIPSGYVSNNNDCNDGNTNVHPGVNEICNSIDDNCNGSIDEGVQLTFYRDADADGYGNSTVTTQACSAPSGYVSNSADCNDANAAVHPGTTEICNGADDNCNGTTDEGVLITFYRDVDGDGYGNAAATTQACSAPSGYVSNSADCNDANVAVHPGITEICNGADDNCNGTIDEGVLTTFYRDVDGDGYGNSAVTTQSCTAPSGYVSNSTDCNDTNPAEHPGATEICNGVDDNCNGTIDEGVLLTFYLDGDGDGFGNSSLTNQSCSAPAGYVTNSSDCNDGNALVHPGATEVCNTEDDNCNGQIDEGTLITYYRDSDGDGFGNSLVITQICSAAPPGYVANSTDCDDLITAVHPGANEICNGIDDNCDGRVDEGVLLTFYRDSDVDGFGNPSISIQACTPPTGFVTDNTDCNDSNNAVHIGAAEIANGLDDNCNGQIDEGLLITFYRDADGDGFGNPANNIQSGSAPPGYVLNLADCNDGNATIYPGAVEQCNGMDDNCNGLIDDGLHLHNFYADVDGDGYGAGALIRACSQPSNTSTKNTDCNDNDAAIHPGVHEICNGKDDNCDGHTDEGLPFHNYYVDVDGDGYGTGIATRACSQPSNASRNDKDCDDINASVHPHATEICNGIDDNCKDGIDEHAEPDKPQLILGPVSVCRNATHLVYSTPRVSGVGLYNWTATNAVIVSGQGSESIVVNWGNRNGKIKVSLSNNCGTGHDKSMDVSAQNCSAKQEDAESEIQEIAEVKQPPFNISIFPNPNRGNFSLIIDSPKEEKAEVSITDVLGQRVYSEVIKIESTRNTYSITMGKFGTGAYVIMVKGAEFETFTQKIVVIK